MTDNSSAWPSKRAVLCGAALIGVGAMLPYAIDRVGRIIRSATDSGASSSSSSSSKKAAAASSAAASPSPSPSASPSSSNSSLACPTVPHRLAGHAHTMAVIHAVPPAPVQAQLAGSGSPAAAAAAVPEEADVLALVTQEFPLWKDFAPIAALPASSFSVKPLLGGSSNTLWLCRITPEASLALQQEHAASSSSSSSSTPLPPLSLVVRFYGSSLDTLIERRSEAEVAELLSRSGIGARILWHFSRPSPGRIEAFVPGRVLRFHELSQNHIANPIAREFARLHCMKIQTQAQQQAQQTQPPRPVVFENLWKYFHVALTARYGAGLRDDASVAGSVSALGDMFSSDAQSALAASLGMPDLSLAFAADPSWNLARVEALDLRDGGDEAKLPKWITTNKWYKEIKWLHALLENWNANEAPAAPASASSSSSSSQPKRPRSAVQQRFIDECVAFSEPGLCHNDLNPGNILYYEDGAPLPDVHSSSSSSSASAVAPARFTLIDFEYAALNLPGFDLANHIAERCLEYSGDFWPFFHVHQGRFPAQENLIDWIKVYAEEKKEVMIPPPPVTNPSVFHLYVSTMTGLFASHLLWSLWGVIQSASVAPSTAAYPSWSIQENGRAFVVPPLAFLEYAEQRMELYERTKRLWLEVNFATGDDEAFGPPPNWQVMESEADWKMWMDQLDDMHAPLKNMQLDSAQRQKEALQRHMQGYKDRGQVCPWALRQH